MENNMNQTQDFKLRQLAGLTYAGKDDEGDNEWIGSEKQWKKYEKLVEEEISNIGF